MSQAWDNDNWAAELWRSCSGPRRSWVLWTSRGVVRMRLPEDWGASCKQDLVAGTSWFGTAACRGVQEIEVGETPLLVGSLYAGGDSNHAHSLVHFDCLNN